MARVTLKGPRSYAVAGKTFYRNQPDVVDDEFAREKLHDTQLFDIVYTEDTKRFEELGVKKVASRPDDADERASQLKAAAETLTPGNKNHFTQKGQPVLTALTDVLGWVVTSADREAVFPVVAATPKAAASAAAPGAKETVVTDAVVEGVKLKIIRHQKPEEKGTEGQSEVSSEAGTGGTIDTGAAGGEEGIEV